jgi:lipopolysaccharide/colanic/teichoic acid biosynthesis glycosyltransferase
MNEPQAGLKTILSSEDSCLEALSPHFAGDLRGGLQHLSYSPEVLQYLELSPWSRSCAKRYFDIATVIALAPILLPILVLIALAVLICSGRPVVFRQRRSGRDGIHFPIYKFRTMRGSVTESESAISIDSIDRITVVGGLLRKTKLDELPQMFNILIGDMSFVGPRPKVPEQQLEPIPCRPGLTSPSTLAFAREEEILLKVPAYGRAQFYYNEILPAKQQIDKDYLRRATIASDLRILFDTVLGRWGAYRSEDQVMTQELELQSAPSEAASLSQ